MAEPVRVAWFDSVGMPSHIHLTADGKETLCGGHAEYLAHRRLTKVPNRCKGRSMYCRTCFMESGRAYSHSLPWDNRCAERDPNEPAWWLDSHDEYMSKKYPKGFVVANR